jgi:hypothetical protein
MAAALTVPVARGQIRSAAGYVYQVTAEDLLWLGRAVEFEGGTAPDATIWTYAQLAVRRNASSLTALIRAHSQPVNPLWDESTDEKCQMYPEHCTVSQLERRARAVATPWSGLSARTRDLVARWAAATLPNPVPRSVDFANPAVSQGFIRRNPGTEIVKKAGNWYLATPDVLDWPRNFVTMTYKGRAMGAGPLWLTWGVGALGLSAVAGALWYFYRKGSLPWM